MAQASDSHEVRILPVEEFPASVVRLFEVGHPETSGSSTRPWRMGQVSAVDVAHDLISVSGHTVGSVT